MRSAFFTAGYRRKCSRICGRSSRPAEVPITSITNGVHAPTWINGDLAVLYDQYFSQIGANGLKTQRCGSWSAKFRTRNSGKSTASVSGSLVAFVRERGMRQRASSQGIARRKSGACPKCSIPTHSPSGFARRFATYKRATLLFRDVERLKRILNNPQRPVQIVDSRQGAPQGSSGQNSHPRDREPIARPGNF